MRDDGRALVVVRMGDTLPELTAERGPFEDWIVHILAADTERTRVLCPYRDDSPLPDPEICRAVILTGSGAMVTDEEGWMLRCERWLRDLMAVEVPLLGICFGHQLLAKALGGRVDTNPRGPEVGTVAIHLRDDARRDPLFQGLPSPLTVQVSHMQTVLQLPPGATSLAYNARVEHHAFRCGRLAWGVQFHPEFDAQVARSYLQRHRDRLLADGQDPDRLLGEVEPSDAGATLLRRFYTLALEVTDAPR